MDTTDTTSGDIPVARFPRKPTRRMVVDSDDEVPATGLYTIRMQSESEEEDATGTNHEL